MDICTFRSLPQRIALRFIHPAFAVGTLLTLALLPALSSAVEPSTDHDVVIVGAGAAGLYAAYELNNLNYNVLVLEASNRHGGRVYSATIGDVGIELGAEQLYPSQNNFVFQHIEDMYGIGAQIEIFAGGTDQDILYSLDGGSFQCLAWAGECNGDDDQLSWLLALR